MENMFQADAYVTTEKEIKYSLSFGKLKKYYFSAMHKTHVLPKRQLSQS